MSKWLYQWIFRFAGVRPLYNEVVVQDRFSNIRSQIRQDLVKLLTQVNRDNQFFRNKFTAFLAANADQSDDTFFENYRKLPALTKQDYAEARQSVMVDSLANVDPKKMELQVEGRPLESVRRLRQGNYLMPMATDRKSVV